MSKHNFVVNRTKFTSFFVQRKRKVVDNAVDCLLTAPSVSEIFALKIKSCP